MLRMLADNQAWLKLSGGERLSGAGAPFADLDSLVVTFCRLNPNKLLWGSDWPHVNFYDAAPDDTLLLDNVERWFGDVRLMRTVLCDNPAKLYGFARH
jgi:predicted TIM-barrel fold metal-dependent hydrolase